MRIRIQGHFAAICLLLAVCKPGDGLDPLVGGEDCTPLTAGTWEFTGPAWGMGDIPMSASLSMDAEACAFTLSNWDMAMDDLPSGGVVDGTSVQLDGLTSYWRTCTGTLAAEGASIQGTCTGDGAAFAMTLTEGTDTGDTGDTQDTGDTGDTQDTGDTDDTQDTGDTDDPPDTGDSGSCEALTAADDWAWDGACPRMVTPFVLAVSGCHLTLSYPSGMTMGMPYSGDVSGGTVTFADDNTVDGCVGTIDGTDHVTGTCASGCAFEMGR